MKEDNIYNKLQEMLQGVKGNFSILEEQIDVDLQVDFFELVNKLSKNKREANDIINDKDKLFDIETSLVDKKTLLAELSYLNIPEAYRIIEEFIKDCDSELKPWSLLALQHCRISLETHLLDEQQIFISTGLGGKGTNLRYFIVGKSKVDGTFSNSQTNLIQTEFNHFFTKYNSIIEDISFRDNYFMLIALIPIEVSINDLIKSALNEINQFGDFIYDEYLVTNVKILSQKEIEKYFKKKHLK